MKIIPKLYICDLDLKRFYDMPIGEPFMIKNKCYSAVQREISSPCENCAFYNTYDDECFYLTCCAYERLDEKDVLFKLIY